MSPFGTAIRPVGFNGSDSGEASPTSPAGAVTPPARMGVETARSPLAAAEGRGATKVSDMGLGILLEESIWRPRHRSGPVRPDPHETMLSSPGIERRPGR